MRAEKIQKHMLRRTVVVGIYEDTNKIVGVLHYADICGQRAGMAGHTPDDGNMYNGYYQFDYIRKVTADERAEFFAWLVSDGRDITDNFARFGGMPRGFEAWRAAQTPVAEQDPACIPFQPHDEPEPVVTPQHKVGDLRVGYSEYTGMADVGRVTSVDGDGDLQIGDRPWCGCCVYEPTRANMARLVEQQRARNIVPELGDLVYAMGRKSGEMPGRVAFVVRVGDAMALARAADVPLMGADNLHILVIRRNPLREVADE